MTTTKYEYRSYGPRNDSPAVRRELRRSMEPVPSPTAIQTIQTYRPVPFAICLILGGLPPWLPLIYRIERIKTNDSNL
jgi:hypothetical protein